MELPCDLGSRMGSLTAKPEVQANYLFLQWAQNLQELCYAISIHGHLDRRISDWLAARHPLS